MCDDKVGQKEGNRRADTRPAAVSTPDNNTIRYAATGGVDSGGGVADTLTSGARPQAVCSVMGGPALCSAPVSLVPSQHVCVVCVWLGKRLVSHITTPEVTMRLSHTAAHVQSFGRVLV